eukprot:437521-Amorphochlora_amoeboformis.AAC.1
MHKTSFSDTSLTTTSTAPAHPSPPSLTPAQNAGIPEIPSPLASLPKLQKPSSTLQIPNSGILRAVPPFQSPPTLQKIPTNLQTLLLRPHSRNLENVGRPGLTAGIRKERDPQGIYWKMVDIERSLTASGCGNPRVFHLPCGGRRTTTFETD